MPNSKSRSRSDSSSTNLKTNNTNPVFLVEEQGITLNIYVQPGSNKDEFAGTYVGRLKLKVRAKAVDGAANESVRRFVAEYFAVAKTSVHIVRGMNSRQKTLRIVGDPALLRASAQKLID